MTNSAVVSYILWTFLVPNLNTYIDKVFVRVYKSNSSTLMETNKHFMFLKKFPFTQ